MKIDLAEGKEKDLAYAINGEVPKILAKAAKQKQCHLIHISTDYVFDGTKATSYREEDLCHPIQVYGKSKWLGERQMLEVYPEALSLRVASLYGSKEPNIISTFIQKMREKDVVEAILDQRSTPTSNLDVVRAIYDLKNEQGIFHFVNEGDASRYDLAVEILRLCEVYHVPVHAKEIRPISQRQSSFIALRPVRSVLCTEKVEKLLHWKIPSWKEALKRYFEVHYGDQE
jgi:dTDP-4-dehydrorhamnose reductase